MNYFPAAAWYMAFALNQMVYGIRTQPRRYVVFVFNQTVYGICTQPVGEWRLYSTTRYMAFVLNQTVYGICTQPDGI
jgi:hypothetical protein